jgi:hypothetical protein
VQFLDDSASLISLGLSRTAQGVRFRRIFSFSYYSEQTGRRQGAVTVIGARIRAYHLDGTTILQDEE